MIKFKCALYEDDNNDYMSAFMGVDLLSIVSSEDCRKTLIYLNKKQAIKLANYILENVNEE